MKDKKLTSQIKKLKKSLNLIKGQRICLYKTDYTVTETNDKFTFLKDPNNNPVAFDTKKLKSIIRGYHASDIKKAMGERMHAGMIRVDKVDQHGKKYHYYVHGQHGTRHKDPSESSAKETHMHPEDQKLHSKMVDAIHKHAHADDVANLSKKLDKWVEAKSAYTHLKEANNQMAKETGGVTSSTVQLVAKKQAEHLKMFNELKTALAASSLKKRG